jgi:hypothetical protein
MDEQQKLVGAIFNKELNKELSKEFSFDPRGLAIYQRNLQTNAISALRITFPTVIKLIGEDVFAYAVAQLIKQDPPSAGDWGLWGKNFSEVLQPLAALQEFPYVADIARLDFSLHVSGREKDNEVDMNSMSLLATCELDQLRVVLSPSVKLIVSEYPIVDIYNANHCQTKKNDQSFNPSLDQAKQKLVENVGQTSLIYRPRYKPLVRAIESPEHDWIMLVQQGTSIGKSLDILTSRKQDFSLEHWLPLAINQNLISHLAKI